MYAANAIVYLLCLNLKILLLNNEITNLRLRVTNCSLADSNSLNIVLFVKLE